VTYLLAVFIPTIADLFYDLIILFFRFLRCLLEIFVFISLSSFLFLVRIPVLRLSTTDLKVNCGALRMKDFPRLARGVTANKLTARPACCAKTLSLCDFEQALVQL
jgi:hypothetical protein